MPEQITRRGFVKRSAVALGAGAVPGAWSNAAAPAGRPEDYIIVEGHRDIWELSDRLKIRDKSQLSPMRDHLVPRLLEAGVSVVIMPPAGDSVQERDGNEPILEGSLRTLDMVLMEIEKTNGKASIIRTKADVPTKPNVGKVQFFLDMEGGASIEIPPEPEFRPERRMALLRQFFRLGVRGMQLTHHARNQLGDGWREGKRSGRLSRFGVEVVQEMNRLGMMIGVSHLSANGVLHACEISKHPIVSTHQNIHPFLKTDLELMEDEVKAIASTDGIVGIRYIERETPYKLLVDEVEHLAKTVGTEHIGIGWLGHDAGHPAVGHVPGFTQGLGTPTGVEAETMRQHWENFIKMLAERGFNDQAIGQILGGNYIRIWKKILPA